jgi:hypothetical protein
MFMVDPFGKAVFSYLIAQPYTSFIFSAGQPFFVKNI